MRSIVFLLCSAAVMATPAFAETYVVNPEGAGDFPTIQAAIDAVQDGDVIELTDGVFTGDGNRDIFWDMKAITIRSQSGDPLACIIDCEGSPSEPHRGFDILYVAEHPWAVLEGITIMNGYALGGGGILLNLSSPLIRDCVLIHNTAILGGGINCDTDSRPTLVRCTFIENSASSNGGGLCI